MRAPALSLPALTAILVAAVGLVGCSGIPTEDVQPDLVAESISFSTLPISQSSTNTITVRFSNRGATSSFSGFAVRLKVRSGAGLVYTSDSSPDGDQIFKGTIEEEQLVSVTFRNVFEDSFSPGSYSFEAIIDAEEEVDELDEDNNTVFADADVVSKVSG